jgi:hypothetical protein
MENFIDGPLVWWNDAGGLVQIGRLLRGRSAQDAKIVGWAEASTVSVEVLAGVDAGKILDIPVEAPKPFTLDWAEEEIGVLAYRMQVVQEAKVYLEEGADANCWLQLGCAPVMPVITSRTMSWPQRRS